MNLYNKLVWFLGTEQLTESKIYQENGDSKYLAGRRDLRHEIEKILSDYDGKEK